MNEILHAGQHCDQPTHLPDEYRKFVEDPNSRGKLIMWQDCSLGD